MSVKSMLDEKGRDIFSVNPNAPLRDAIKVLNARNVGVVLVTEDDGVLAGILSERDIIRRSLSQETGFRDEAVSKSMTKNVICVSENQSVAEVMETMTNARIRHVPVVDEGSIRGVISIGDVVKRKIAEAEQEAAALRDYISAG